MSNGLPANIDILFGNDNDIAGMRPIKVLDIMEGLTKNFHPDGLFSADIFGKVGGEMRKRLYSYIDLKVPIIHPNLYKVIVRMKELYEQILMGKAFAVFNPDTKDFEKSTALLGETGYSFFMKHWPKVVLEGRDSVSRMEGIKLLKKYKDNILITKLIVMPAGLRDYFVDDSGKPTEDAINEFYRKIMKTCFSLETISIKDSLDDVDSIRANLQKQVVAIYEYLIDILSGKHGAIQSHWTTRAIYNSTRNVITSYIPRVDVLGGDRSVDPNQTVVGLYQFLRAYIPMAVKQVREKFSQRIFPSQNAPAALINKKTLKREQVTVNSKVIDKWMTYEGVEKVFANFGIQALRHRELEVDGYYMALLYRGKDGTVKMIFDIDEIPEDRREDADVKPITMSEMLYLCTQEIAKDQYGFVTRYPVAGYGGIYPSRVYLRSTMDTEILTELDEFWQPRTRLVEFPVRGASFMDSMAPAACHLAALGADFDGDKVSFTGVWTVEAREELATRLNDWSFYVNAKGTMAFSMNDDIISITLASMTKRIA